MKKLIWIILSILLIIGVVYGIILPKQPKGTEVRSDNVQEKEIKAYLSTTGDIISKNKQLYFGEQGVIDDIKVDVGDKVEKDDVLMTIKTGYGTKKLRTDIDGVVTEINVSEGQMNSLAQPAVVVQDTDDLQVKIQLSKYDAPTVKVNQIVDITYNDKIYKGKVSSIDPTADKNSNQTMSSNSEVYQNAYIDIENSKDLVIGFNVDVDILTAQKEKTLVIPIEAVTSDKDGNDFVYVVKNSKASKNNVELGIVSDTEAEIKSGLAKNEEIILNPGTNVTNGVDVIVSPKEENK